MSKIKVEKSEWLKLGVETFSVSGWEGFNVEQFASKLNCNKSSFYWHFKSKDVFLKETIEYWFDHSVKPISTTISKITDPHQRFLKFLTSSFQDKSRKDFMFFLRRLSSKDSDLIILVDKMTRTRLEFTTSMIMDLGYSNKDARIKAEILFNFYLGWYELNKQNTTNEAGKITHAINLIKTFIPFNK